VTSSGDKDQAERTETSGDCISNNGVYTIMEVDMSMRLMVSSLAAAVGLISMM